MLILPSPFLSPQESLIDIPTQIGSHNDNIFVLLNSLQQKGNLDIGTAINGIVNLGTLVEKRFGTIEQQNHIAVVRRSEDPIEVFPDLG